jgi:hypothetical protein
MHRNALLHILADVEQRLALCEAELAYRRARLDRVGQATREAIDAIAGLGTVQAAHERRRGLILHSLSSSR